MTIIYYPLEVENKQYKIKGEHTGEWINLYTKHELLNLNSKVIDDWNSYVEECHNEFNTAEEYDRQKFLNIS